MSQNAHYSHLILNTIYVFLIHNNEWIYIICALGLFWFSSELIRARGMLRRAMFGMERERGLQRQSNALIFIALFAFIAANVFYVNRYVAADLPQNLIVPATPTPNIFRTPLSPPTPLSTAVNNSPATPELVPTVTLALPPDTTSTPQFAPDETAVPNSETAESPIAPPTPSGPTPTPFIGCNVLLNISDPSDGAFIPGSTSFFGTTNTENFGFYRLEANGPQTNGEWASLLGRDMETAADDGMLGRINLSQWSNGPYLIKLSSYDFAGNKTGECVIQVTLNNN